jgi:GNAT superfamily N-acetyltransferase
MSLFAEYLREREGKEIVESDRGFATFQVLNNECYIEDIYVVPEYRQTGEAAKMANQIAEQAKTRGCVRLLGSVVPTARGSTTSLKVLLAYGFRLLRSDNNFIVLSKDL